MITGRLPPPDVRRENSLRAKLPRIAQENAINIIGANWTVPEQPDWHGYGQTLIVERTGRVLARASRDIGEESIYFDLPIAHVQQADAPPAHQPQ